MNAGLSVYNDTNTIQIDSTFRNWRLVDKGTFLAGDWDGDGYGSNPRTVITVVNGVNPILAYNGFNSYIRVMRRQSGSTFTFTFTFRAWGPAGRPTCNYFIFDAPPATISGGSAGLQVWNSAGALCFDSSYQYMRVLDLLAGSATFPLIGTRTETHSYPGVGNVAIVPMQQAMRINVVTLPVGPGGLDMNFRDVFTVTGNALNTTVTLIDSLEYEQPGDAVAYITQPAYSFLVLDVTNY